MKKDRKFEDFLKEWHAKDYHGTDDDMPDAFDSWLSGLEVDSLMSFADIFAIEEYIRGMERAKELALKALKEN